MKIINAHANTYWHFQANYSSSDTSGFLPRNIILLFIKFSSGLILILSTIISFVSVRDGYSLHFVMHNIVNISLL